MYKHGLVVAGALAVAVFAAPAQALLITESSVGDATTIQWLLADGATDPNGNTNNTGQDITAEAILEVGRFDIVNDFIDLFVRATNTTAANDDEVGLWKIGFGTTPDATGVAFLDADDGEFTDAVLDTSNQFPDRKIIDVTSSTDTGTKRTLQAGESDSFLLRVSFSDLVLDTVVELSPFNAAFQSNPDSFQVRGTTPGTPVPVPGTLGLLGLGLLGLGRLTGSRRRTR